MQPGIPKAWWVIELWSIPSWKGPARTTKSNPQLHSTTQTQTQTQWLDWCPNALWDPAALGRAQCLGQPVPCPPMALSCSSQPSNLSHLFSPGWSDVLLPAPCTARLAAAWLPKCGGVEQSMLPVRTKAQCWPGFYTMLKDRGSPRRCLAQPYHADALKDSENPLFYYWAWSQPSLLLTFQWGRVSVKSPVYLMLCILFPWQQIPRGYNWEDLSGSRDVPGVHRFQWAGNWYRSSCGELLLNKWSLVKNAGCSQSHPGAGSSAFAPAEQPTRMGGDSR